MKKYKRIYSVMSFIWVILYGQIVLFDLQGFVGVRENPYTFILCTTFTLGYLVVFGFHLRDNIKLKKSNNIGN